MASWQATTAPKRQHVMDEEEQSVHSAAAPLSALEIIEELLLPKEEVACEMATD